MERHSPSATTNAERRIGNWIVELMAIEQIDLLESEVDRLLSGSWISHWENLRANISYNQEERKWQ